MPTQADWEVITRAHQIVSTMASRLRYFSRMNPPTFYVSKVDKDLQEFFDEIYKIHYAMGLNTSEKYYLATYKLNNVVETWHVQ